MTGHSICLEEISCKRSGTSFLMILMSSSHMDHPLVCLTPCTHPSVNPFPTHCAGHGDLCVHGGRAGCVNLLLTIQQRVRPRYHVFGHIHEGTGRASTCILIISTSSSPPQVTESQLTGTPHSSTAQCAHTPINQPMLPLSLTYQIRTHREMRRKIGIYRNCAISSVVLYAK